jgi:acyl-CoA synthetase (AMP-forming)/AMP-acid ligase II
MGISTIRYLLEKSAKMYKDKVAITSDNESITYSELIVKVNKVANYLNKLNLEDGSRIAVHSEKSISQVIAILAILSTKFIVVHVSHLLKLDQVNYILDDCQISCVMTNTSKIESLDSRREIIVLDNIDKDIFQLESEDFVTLNISSNNCAAIIYSSGSTGFPKGIVLSHKNLFDGARIVSNYTKLNSNDVISGVLAFDFDIGLNQLYCSLYNGATLALHRYFLPNNFFKYLVDCKVTVLALMPIFLNRMFDKNMISSIDVFSLCSVKTITSSGGKITPKMMSDIDKYFKNSDFYSMYGLTEAFRSSYLHPSQIKERPESIGKAIPEVELYIINENGHECEPGEVGEIIHRGGCIGKGYWGRVDDTNERYVSIDILSSVIQLKKGLIDEKVVRSGDLAYKDKEGYIYFVSRKDDMIKSSGYRISPYEIENSVYKHFDRIKECAIFSVESQEIGQEIIMAYVSSEVFDVCDIKSSLAPHLPGYMIPTTIFKLNSMPVTVANQGKIDKKTVKEMFLYEQSEL